MSRAQLVLSYEQSQEQRLLAALKSTSLSWYNTLVEHIALNPDATTKEGFVLREWEYIKSDNIDALMGTLQELEIKHNAAILGSDIVDEYHLLRDICEEEEDEEDETDENNVFGIELITEIRHN